MPTPAELRFTTHAGTVVNLDSYVRLDGFGTPPLNVRTRQAPQSAGATISQVQPRLRQMVVTVLVEASNTPQTAAQLQTQIQRLAADLLITQGGQQQRLGILEWYGFNDERRQIQCGVTSGFESIANVGPFAAEVAIRFTAPRPFWFSPAQTVMGPVATMVGGDSPILGGDVGTDPSGDSLPWTLGLDRQMSISTLANAGDALVDSLEVSIVGPAVNPLLWNRSDPLGRLLQFDGVLNTGDVLTVKMGSSVDNPDGWKATTDDGADWTSAYRLNSRPIALLPGANQIVYAEDLTTTDPTSTVTFRYRNHYLGVGV